MAHRKYAIYVAMQLLQVCSMRASENSQLEVLPVKRLDSFTWPSVHSGDQGHSKVLSENSPGSFASPKVDSATLSPEFFRGGVRLSPRIKDALLKVKGNALVIQKMNDYLEKSDLHTQEMFIEMLNEKNPYDITSNKLSDYVNQVIALTDRVTTHNWLTPAQNSSFRDSLGESFRSVFTRKSRAAIKMEKLFKSALTGDRSSIEEIHELAKTKLNLSADDKRALLTELQLQAAQSLEEINEQVPEKNIEAQDKYLEDPDRQAEEMREIGLQQEANARAVVKYCKDVLRALRPMCHSGQHLMSIVDRETLAPVLNMIEFKDFPIDSVRSKDELTRFIASKVAELESLGKIKTPIHSETKPKFIQSVQDAILRHHPDIKLRAELARESIAKASDRDQALADHTQHLKQMRQQWMSEHVQARLNKIVDRRGFEGRP